MNRLSPARRRLLSLGGFAAALLLPAAYGSLAAAGTVGAPCGTPRVTASAARGGAGPVRVAARLDRTAIQAGAAEPGRVRVELTLAAERRPSAGRRPTDFYVVLDRSGSMEGDKIAHARRAVHELIDRLGDGDRFALVSYSSDARVDVPLAAATTAAGRAWQRQVATIEASGGTAMSLGLDLALREAGEERQGRAARLLLLSDGLANEADFSPEGLAARARRAAAAAITVSTLGVGLDFNEVLMTDLATAGLGNYYFLPGAEQIAGVLASELEATRETVAEEVEVALLPAAGVTVAEVAGYPLARRGDRLVFQPGNLFAGQERRVWVTLEASPAGVGTLDLVGVEASFTSDGDRRSAVLAEPLRVAAVATAAEALAAIDPAAWGQAVVEEDYGRLQEEVAADVRAGDRDEALRKIAAYVTVQATVNARVQSPVVTDNLAAVTSLEAEVEAAFTGDDQADRQNTLAKVRQATGYDARRSGAKREPAVTPPAPAAVASATASATTGPGGN